MSMMVLGRRVFFFFLLVPSRINSLAPKFPTPNSVFRLSSKTQYVNLQKSRRDLHLGRISAMAEGITQKQKNKHRHVNRLASEHSPYLLQHAHNPVDWYPWGQEAFDKAKEKNMPIFLSIGYSTCHWCHVMEVESFENEEVAELLNKWFVSIKVDREERPDVDKVYMTYVQAVYGGGGWPLSVFLSPNLVPVMGGTYFPPDDKYGRPGFKTVLSKVRDAWDTKKEMLEKSGNYAIEQLSEALSASASLHDMKEDHLQGAGQTCAAQLAKSFDDEYGGFGSAPKFPRPVEIQLILYQTKKLEEGRKETKAKTYLGMASFSLQCMARGGIHDHIGGGFHRYSVDECWHVPHFEKMMYDQGQLANVCLDVFAITKDSYYSAVARDILDYVSRDMIGDAGGIFSAEDADSAESEGAARKKEGAFYVWTTEEVDDVIGGPSAKLFKQHYYMKPSGNCDLSRMSDPHGEFKGKNVLIERKTAIKMSADLGLSLDEYLDTLAEARQKLFHVRSKRPRPHLDDKVIVAWNGLAISAFARASKILKAEPPSMKSYFPVIGCNPDEYMEVAEKAALFVKNHLYDSTTHRLHHSFRNGPSKAPGFLDDYAFFISSLLDMYEYGGRTCWLSWAMELQKTQDELFLDKAGGGYFNTPGEDPTVLLRVKEDHDGAEPSGNSVSAINLIRLSSLVSGDLSSYYKNTARHLLAVFEKRLKDYPVAVPLMCCAADMLTVGSRKQVVLVGHKKEEVFQDMVVAVHSIYDPNRTVIQIDPKDEDDMRFWKGNNESIALMAKRSPIAETAVAYVCMNFTCSAPVIKSHDLTSLLQGGMVASSSTSAI